MLQTIRKLLAPLTLVALVGFAGGARAETVPIIGPTGSYHFGTLNTSRGVSVNGIDNNFDNTFSFIQGAFPAVTGMLAGLDAGGDMEAEYRFGVGGTSTGSATWFGWSVLASVPSDEGAFAFSQTMTNLTPGTRYWFELKGYATQATYTLTLAPVPEPESWALMLAGLGLMGFIARRRQVAAA